VFSSYRLQRFCSYFYWQHSKGYIFVFENVLFSCWCIIHFSSFSLFPSVPFLSLTSFFICFKTKCFSIFMSLCQKGIVSYVPVIQSPIFSRWFSLLDNLFSCPRSSLSAYTKFFSLCSLCTVCASNCAQGAECKKYPALMWLDCTYCHG